MKRLFYLMVMLLVASCSLKEDRAECPWYISVRVLTDQDCVVSFYDSEGNLFERSCMTSSQLQSGDNYTKVKEGFFSVSVVKGIGDNMLFSDDRTISCRKETEADSILCCCIRDNADSDKMVEGELRKQYTTVNLGFVESSKGYSYDLRVTSQYNGIDLISLIPVAGEYRIMPVIDEKTTTSFKMTRQMNSEPIYLYLYDKETGKQVRKIDLNHYIQQTGFDWESMYLSDISIQIDYTSLTLSIRIDDWDEVKVFDYLF